MCGGKLFEFGRSGVLGAEPLGVGVSGRLGAAKAAGRGRPPPTGSCSYEPNSTKATSSQVSYIDFSASRFRSG